MASQAVQTVTSGFSVSNTTTRTSGSCCDDDYNWFDIWFLRMRGSSEIRKAVGELRQFVADESGKILTRDIYNYCQHSLSVIVVEAVKDCRHTQTVCNRCKKRGHLAKVCRSAPAFETNAAVTNQVTRSEVPEYVLHAAAPTNRVQPPYQVELQVNSAPMVFELDTGSAVTLCSEKSWQDNLGPTVKDKLQQAPVRLRTYTGEEVKLLGTKNVNVSYKGVTVNETIYIAEGNGQTC
ncbi:protein TSPEAR-like [Clonorchis sinensis]|uniref:Protein TSPEAR-like n=1 Tax=Clonorchis sinensis TaxID=79923 RepID=G7Y3S5_CLOSI|nr:protein TSPEAR-like [Clonorchis sinensis]